MGVFRLALLVWLMLVLAGAGSAQQRLYDPDPLCVVVFGDAEARRAARSGDQFASSLEAFLESRGVPSVVQPTLRRNESALQALARFEQDVLAREPDVVVWRFGWQDGAEPDPGSPGFATEVREALARLEKRGIQALVVTAPARTDQRPGEVLSARLDELRRLAGLSSAALLDAQGLLPAELGSDFQNDTPERLTERGQAQFARLVAEHIVRLETKPRTLPLKRTTETLEVLRAGQPTSALIDRAGRSLEHYSQYLDTTLLLGSGTFEIEGVRNLGATVRLDLARSGSLEIEGQELRLSGDLFGGGTRIKELSTNDRRFLLRRRGPRRIELLIGDRVVHQFLWAADLGTLRLPGDLNGWASLTVTGAVRFAQTYPPHGPATPTLALRLDELSSPAATSFDSDGSLVPSPPDLNPKWGFRPESFVDTARPNHWLAFRSNPSTKAIEISESFDQGRQFSRARTLLHPPGLDLQAPVAIRLGERLLLFLCDSDREVVHLCESTDRGRSFTTPRPVGRDLGFHAMDVAALNDRELLILGRGSGETILWAGTPEALRAGEPGRLRVSIQNGRTELQLFPNPDGSYSIRELHEQDDCIVASPAAFFPDVLEALVQERLAQ